VYVAVLGVALIIALIGAASIHLARAETDVLVGAQQMAYAELLSQSAAEWAVARVMCDGNWRINHGGGGQNPSPSGLNFGGGNIKYILNDGDGNLNDDSRDVLTVSGVARYRGATQVTTVQLEPMGSPLACIQAGMVVHGNLWIAAATVTTDRNVVSNGSIDASAGAIDGNAWAVGSISGPVTGTSTAGAGAYGMANNAELWAYYLANGTKIDIASIPNQTIEKVVLSAGSNPYGMRNPQGIYIIDTQGQSLCVRDARIAATLVIISPGASTALESRLNWAPPAPNFPALLVDGSVTFDWQGGADLSEAAAGVNFNPAGTPFEGDADADATDLYPGILKGFVYCTGNVAVTSPCIMRGSLIAEGWASVSAPLTIAFHASARNTPPPGFAHGNVMRVIPRTWRREAPKPGW
jgi:hypothetical protein